MVMIPVYPVGLDDEDVGVFNEELKSIWQQERALLNYPLANFRFYTYSLESGAVVTTLTQQFDNVEVSVPDLDDEVLVNSGGLILPTDRFLSAYDVQPHMLSIVEWPSNSGNIFSFRRMEYNPRSGRLETLIRQGNNLSGRIYRRLLSEKPAGSNWKIDRTYKDILITANRSDLFFDDRMLFTGIVEVGDIVFWSLKEAFTYVNNDGVAVPFTPSVHDFILDKNHLGRTETYEVTGVQLDQMQGFYRLLCRRVTERGGE